MLEMSVRTFLLTLTQRLVKAESLTVSQRGADDCLDERPGLSADVAALGLFNSVRCAEIASRRCNYRLGQPVSMPVSARVRETVHERRVFQGCT